MNNEERDDKELEPEEPVLDAEDLVIDERSVDDRSGDDEDYEEVIVLDLRQPDTHDLWLC